MLFHNLKLCELLNLATSYTVSVYLIKLIEVHIQKASENAKQKNANHFYIGTINQSSGCEGVTTWI